MTEAIPLFIKDIIETIHCVFTIFNFTKLAQYLLHNNEILFYLEHALYRLDKTKIIFENYCLIDSKLFRTTFNYPKFHNMIHFVKYIQEYGSMINYDMTYSKIAHKYLLKTFYR